MHHTRTLGFIYFSSRESNIKERRFVVYTYIRDDRTEVRPGPYRMSVVFYAALEKESSMYVNSSRVLPCVKRAAQSAQTNTGLVAETHELRHTFTQGAFTYCTVWYRELDKVLESGSASSAGSTVEQAVRN